MAKELDSALKSRDEQIEHQEGKLSETEKNKVAISQRAEQAEKRVSEMTAENDSLREELANAQVKRQF